MEHWRERKTTNMEMGVVVSLWIACTIVRYLQNISFERMSFGLTDWRFIHHIEMRTGLFSMDSDYLAKNHNWGTYFGDAIDTQGIGGAIIIWYSTNRWKRNRNSTNRRHDCYPILNKLSEARSILKQSSETLSILNESCYRCERKRWLDPLDTQQIVGDTINTQQILRYVWAEALIRSIQY